MVLADNIRYLRKKRGWSQDYLAERLGYKSYTTIQKWESGVSEPPLKKAHAIADLFGVDINDLTGSNIEDAETKLPSDAISYAPTQRIPILGRISAGLPLYAEEQIEGYTYTALNYGGEYFALRVHGDSMDALGIKEGYLVIVRRQDYVDNGTICVVLVGDNEATMKRFYQDGDTVTLMPQSTNPKHMPQIYNLKHTPIHIIGKVVKVEFTLD